MSERYRTSHYAGSVFVIIDTASSEKMNMEDACRELNEQADRLNALERENKRFRDVLGMDDGENPETLRQELMELAEVTIRIREENADLNAELTETIAAVSDLMDENADLNHQLAEVYKSCISAMYSVVMGSASLDTRTAFESAEGAIRALIPKETTDD